MGLKSLFFTPAAERPQLLVGLSRLQTGDVAPQGRYSETTGFARGAPQLVNFFDKNNTFLRRIPKPGLMNKVS
jgi:hypothetical protein